jgi:hypothetical protein
MDDYPTFAEVQRFIAMPDAPAGDDVVRLSVPRAALATAKRIEIELT